ncbi:PIN2/TERF1-interacting telomerase inhibitor 1-like [Ctenocephalides felis]|uniref:PIN2/TERF1-interacting telomerase inhibitor 1-like n=1 Tax=Ctenocephalides felis TaxID=7515 RepID=UPI000E6E3448|nr:PIN2/TERF1-interacting telomerase inhibitor 1-like [Ctenocephalides felis]
MAMLAERKRKVKWALNPRGKQWSEDSNKFGQKLLEKMGWTSGKGLGVNESGITEHIKVAFKNDSQGIGYKLRDDQWTQHEDQFNSLLSSLNGESIVKNDTQVEEEVTSCSGFGFKDKNKETVVKELSGESLEDKSKKSKARVQGKDISRYSEKDLANIFGKKVDDIKTEENKTVSNVESDPPKATEDNEKKDFSFGITTIETKLSISDYFKSKMPIKKTNKYIVGSDGVLKTLKEENVNNDQEIDTFRPSFNLNEKISKEEESVRSTEHEITSEFDRQDGFRPSFNLEQTESSCNVTNKVENHNSKGAITENPDTNMEENTAYKKNKKIKKSKEDVMDVIPDPKEIIEFDQNSNDCKIVKKKKKKDKKSKSTKSNADNGMDNEESKTVTSEDTTDGLEVQNKGKQKNIVKHNILDGELLINGDVENVLETADKSKKKKKKHVFQNNEINENISKDESVLNVAECTSNILSDNCNKKNKKNKNKDISLDEEIIVHSEKEQNNINTIDKGIDSCIKKKKVKRIRRKNQKNIVTKLKKYRI